MYRTCIFCNKPLGSNEVVESFPVGRRLAFDTERGRLWVVCRRCERWNLTPLDERWEAVEDCERIFRGTRVRVSTDNIGLARHPEGLTLVRIGEPLRPEFAAWRYGDQFGRRRKVALYGGVVIAAATGLTVGGLVAGAAISTSLFPIHAMQWYLMRGRRVRLRLEDGRVLGLKGYGGRFSCRMRPADGDGTGFRIQVEKFIGNMPEPTRLALEMALHEEQERRALEGELWLLEQAWRDAEEIAAISDDLLLPEGAEDFVRERGWEGDGGRAS